MNRPATTRADMPRALASRRDKAFYARPNANLAKVYHVYNHGTSHCGRSVLNRHHVVDATTVPGHLRCRRNGCDERWPQETPGTHGAAPTPATPDSTGPHEPEHEARHLDLIPEDWALLAQMRLNFTDTTYPNHSLDYYRRVSMLRLVRAGLVTFNGDTCHYTLHIDIEPYLEGRSAALADPPQDRSANPYDQQRQRFQHHAWNNGHAQRAHTRNLA